MNPNFTLDSVITAIGDYTEDAILITEAEPIDEPGPRIVWCNPAFTRMTGYTLDEIKGQTPRLLQGLESDRDVLDRIRHALAAWEPVRVELKNYHKDGTPFWVEFIIRPVADDTGWYRFWISIQRETTDRREREMLLETTSKALDTAPIGLGLLSADMRLTYANRALEQVFFPGTPPPFLPLDHQAWVARSPVVGSDRGSNTDWKKAHVQGLSSTPFSIEQVIDGTWYAFQRIVLPDGSSLLIVDDASERRDLQQRLDHLVKLESMGQLTGGVAHDFNNFLAVILGNLELLKMGTTSHERDEFIQDAIDAVLRGRKLTQQLLSFARKSRLQREEFGLAELLPGLESTLLRTLPESVDLSLQMEPDLPLVLIDSGQLETAILNLAINARDAMDGVGHLSISVRMAPDDAVHLDGLRSSVGTHFVELRVSDTGPGIPEAILARVVEPFFTTKEVGAGSGLGLSMVHGFVEQSGGTMHIASVPGQGTQVSLFLPVLKVAARPGAEVPRQAPALQAGMRVLIVEDDEGVRRIVRLFLRELNWVVEEAMSGDAAIAAIDAASTPYALVISDLVMPGRAQGVDVLAHAAAKMPRSARILMSGNPDQLAAGAQDFRVLIKPVRRDELLSAISAAQQG